MNQLLEMDEGTDDDMPGLVDMDDESDEGDNRVNWNWWCVGHCEPQCDICMQCYESDADGTDDFDAPNRGGSLAQNGQGPKRI